METLSHYWPFVQGIHQSLVDSLHKGPVIHNFAVSFVVSQNKLLNKQPSSCCLRCPKRSLMIGNHCLGKTCVRWLLFHDRLLHSPNRVAVGLSVWYETWPPIGWHHPAVISWSRYRLGLPRVAMHCGFMWLVGIATVFHRSLTVSLHNPNGRQMPVIRAVQGDCERV